GPCVSARFRHLRRLDWLKYAKSSPRVQRLFGESTEFGIGRQGITFPIRGPKGEAALFNITSDLPDAEWLQTKKIYMRDFQILAHIIHAKAMVIGGAEKPDYQARLTPRERECLTWGAGGKPSEDIATI